MPPLIQIVVVLIITIRNGHHQQQRSLRIYEEGVEGEGFCEAAEEVEEGGGLVLSFLSLLSLSCFFGCCCCLGFGSCLLAGELWGLSLWLACLERRPALVDFWGDDDCCCLDWPEAAAAAPLFSDSLRSLLCFSLSLLCLCCRFWFSLSRLCLCCWPPLFSLSLRVRWLSLRWRWCPAAEEEEEDWVAGLASVVLLCRERCDSRRWRLGFMGSDAVEGIMTCPSGPTSESGGWKH